MQEFQSITAGSRRNLRAVRWNRKPPVLEELRIDAGALRTRADELRQTAQTVMFAAIDGQAAGLVGVSDPVKPSTREAIEALHRERVKVLMLTGDNRTTAEAVAKSVGIDAIEAEVLPDQKAMVVTRLQQQGRRVAMAGDGINDAPALAQADVGIAMGTGTDIAMESAGVTLVRGDLRGIVRGSPLSRATIRTSSELSSRSCKRNRTYNRRGRGCTRFSGRVLSR